jgi:hypothetical protein
MKVARRLFRNIDISTQSYTESYSRRLASFRKPMTFVSKKEIPLGLLHITRNAGTVSTDA